MEEQSTPSFWLSPQQQHIWLTQTGDRPWNAAILACIEGSLDGKRLQDALDRLVARHEVLRTAFRHLPGMKAPFQSPRDDGSVQWLETNISEFPADEQTRRLDGLFRSELACDFDFKPSGGPLLRAHLVRQDTHRTALILTVPAMLSDAPSLSLLLREISSLYAEDTKGLDEDPLRFVQISQWQTELLESDDETARSGKAFWSQPSISVPGPESLPLASRGAGAFLPDSVSFTIADSLLQFDYSAEIAVLAAWQSLVWRLSGQALFGTRVFFNGREHDELRNAPGLVGRFLPVPARFDGAFSFIDVMDHVQAAMTAAAEWQEYCPSPSGTAEGTAVLFEYFGGVSDWVSGPLAFSISSLQAHIERFGIKLSVVRGANCHNAVLFYDSSLLANRTAERWVRNFETLLTAAGKNPRQPVSQLELLPETERSQILVEWNRTSASYPKDRCIHELFESQADRTPDRLAVRSQGKELSYRELNIRANKLARHLQILGVHPSEKVALCLNPGVDLITGLLAILKAGAAYVPLNADSPKPRLLQQLSVCALLLTESGLLAPIEEFGGPMVCIDADASRWETLSPTNPTAGATPEDLVYIIYTSGSTGVPKGVAVRHRNLVNYTHYIAKWLKLDEYPNGLNFATVTTIAADLGNTCIFPSLTSGGCLHLPGHEAVTDAALLGEFNQRYAIDVLKIVPSHLEALLTSSGSSVLPAKYLILGGEPLQHSLVNKVEQLSASCQVRNHYGPTETTVGSLTLNVPTSFPPDWPTHGVPIGTPISNTRAYVLDSRLEPVPIGVRGELYIGGDGVTAGYLDSPELTNERYLKNPFVTGDTVYRTGDLARFLSDGSVEYLGRTDDQVKIRGYRIELGEIEAAISRFEGIKQVAVSARYAKGGERQLVAYLVPSRTHEVNITHIREYLKTQLPGYMLPGAMVVLPRLPLTPNGKLDRATLPDPEIAQLESRQYIAPETATEVAVANIWALVFRRERISVTDDFFEIGGHSLLATQVISRLREQFRIEISMRTMFEGPNIRALSRVIDQAPEKEIADDELENILPVSRDAYRQRSN